MQVFAWGRKSTGKVVEVRRIESEPSLKNRLISCEETLKTCFEVQKRQFVNIEVQ